MRNSRRGFLEKVERHPGSFLVKTSELPSSSRCMVLPYLDLRFSYTLIDFIGATARKEAHHGPTENGVIRIHWSRVGSRIHGYYVKSTRFWYQWHRDARLKVSKLAVLNHAIPDTEDLTSVSGIARAAKTTGQVWRGEVYPKASGMSRLLTLPVTRRISHRGLSGFSPRRNLGGTDPSRTRSRSSQYG